MTEQRATYRTKAKAQPRSYTISLPWPLSVNKLYKYGGRVKREEAYDYADTANLLARQKYGIDRPLTPPIKLTMWAFLPDKRKHDLDNLFKVVVDSISLAFCFDDNLIHEIHAYKVYTDGRKGEVDVTVEELREVAEMTVEEIEG